MVVLVAGAIQLSSGAARAAGESPWQAADAISKDLFGAQTALLLGEPADGFVARAAARLRGPLLRGLQADAPRDLRRLHIALAAAGLAVEDGAEDRLGAARGSVIAATRRAAMTAAIAAARRGDPSQARQWLQIRDFRKTTRFSRPGVSATAALQELESGDLGRREAAAEIERDLLDTYQARLKTNLDEAAQAAERGFAGRLAEASALAAGYWQILRAEYAAQRGAAERVATNRDFQQFAAIGVAGDERAFGLARARVEADLEGFTAAPLTVEEESLRASQLDRFLDLVPKEYEKGTSDGRVTIPFEVQEAVAFMDGVETAFADLEPALLERDPVAVAAIRDRFATLREAVDAAYEEGRVVSDEKVSTASDRALAEIEAISPETWETDSDEADYELVDISLDQLEAAVAAGRYQEAEQARLAAYGFFEFGPELKLNAFDPQLAIEIEGFFWYGAAGDKGFANLLADNAPVTEVRETRLDLDERLADARQITGDGASTLTTITNSALIVFREGLEAILILAAITASMLGPRERLRRPVYRGALLALPASLLMFVLAIVLLDSLSKYGEKLEAVVGVVAIGVLLLVMNWFFHKVYWTEWIKGHRDRGKVLTGAALTAGAGAATVAGLYTLGFTSVFREGFETVLFLQALQLSSGTGVVLAGVSLGLVLTGIVGAVTFALERKLPYKKMLIVTGVLIALVLVVLVGNTARTMQGVGWLSIHPIDIEFPLWMGTWLGIYPTVETLTAQLAAFVFVAGSYFAAEWMRKRELRKAIAAHEASVAGEEEDEHRVDRDVQAVGAAVGGINQGIDRTP